MRRRTAGGIRSGVLCSSTGTPTTSADQPYLSRSSRTSRASAPQAMMATRGFSGGAAFTVTNQPPRVAWRMAEENPRVWEVLAVVVTVGQHDTPGGVDDEFPGQQPGVVDRRPSLGAPIASEVHTGFQIVIQ